MVQLKSNKNEILLESGTNELEVIEFTIDNQYFGINVAKVEEILRYDPNITPMPHSNTYVEGVFKPRDLIITIIDLAGYLGLPPSGNPENDILIITKFNKVSSAFHVHSVDAIHRISWRDIEKPDAAIYGGQEGVATGIARYENRLITIIDFEKIISDINPAAAIQLDEIDKLGEWAPRDKQLMVVEDSPLLQKMILKSLEKAGFSKITLCHNGEEAWSQLQNLKENGSIVNQLGAVITDIEMPRMDGHHLLKLIRDDADLGVMPVIIFSSLIDEQMYEKGENLGATAQLTKPEIGNLVRLIDQHAL
ncbi:MAG: chemotaxis protein [Clostridiales bacterium]|jgi:two-component system chemotaxis response regulator CheV|nr:chemotaxis protein [Clostridiales bacterium]